jgi:hypothetical protein
VTHKWSSEHFDQLRTCLRALPHDVGAVKLWAMHEAVLDAGVGWRQ